jgi:hypothetical protein
MLEEMRDLIEDSMKDANKFDEKRNKSAGTRVRKVMQELKSHAQDVRKKVIEIKKQ